MNFKLNCHPLKVIATVALSACYQLAFAGSTVISNSPLPVNSSVVPNILFAIDTSGSMVNIVPGTPADTPSFDPNVIYLGTCPDVFADGVAAPLCPSTNYTASVDGSGAVTIGGVTFGTGSGQKCFDPALRYLARLNSGQTFLGATYTGNYLNWYFCTGAAPNCNTAANFGAGATRKPNTKNRLEITKSSAKIIVDSLSNVRTGLVRYAPSFSNSTTAAGGQLSVQLTDNNATQKTTMKTAIDLLDASANTPLSGTLSGIGAYLAKSAAADPTLTLHPATPAISSFSGSSAHLNTQTTLASTLFVDNGKMLLNGVAGTPTLAPPIQYYCQKSFAIVMTDGRPNNGYNTSAKMNDYLGIMSGVSTTRGQKPTSGTANHANANGKTQSHLGDPHSYEGGGDDYLDDIAAALYDIDLRPDLLPALVGGVQPAKAGKNNLFTYTIALADLQAINDPLLQETAAAGGGLFLPAADSDGLVTAFDAAVNDILSKDGSAAAVAVANAHITSSDNAAYYTSYNAGTWSGELIAYKLDINTGRADVTKPIWDTGCADPTAYIDPSIPATGVRGCSAQVMLDLRTATDRKIFTTDDSTACLTNCGKPFQVTSGNLTSTQLTRLRTNTLSTGSTAIAEATDVVNYMRGDQSKDNTTMRKRIHLLGDTVNAEPLVIRKPERNYGDLDYVTYREANNSRAVVILQAANDGMLHAFNELTGAEEWAYIPGMLINDSNDPADSSISLLNTRTRKNGFNHYYLLDATPVAGDVDLANSGTIGVTTTQWATIVVGGMGKGGRGYYALDLSTPTATTETLAAAKALWEFPRSVVSNSERAAAKLNMGYSFAKPIIIKTQAKGWVVLVSSGYNNGTSDSGGDGLGHLYVLNAKTGDLIADLTTPATNCNASNPCGFSAFNAYVEAKDSDNTAELVYGGDLYGNLWRFDLRGTTVAGWTVSKMATLRSGTSSTSPVQPITTVPELARIKDNTQDNYMVYVGTGMYLGRPDLPCPLTGSCPWTPNSQSTQTQTMYGLKDSRTNVATVETLTSLPDPLKVSTVLQEQTYGSGAPRVFTHTTVDFTSQKGWYVDFTNGERLVTDPLLAVGQIIFTSNIPNSEPCIPGGSSWIYALDYATGGAVRLSNGTFSQKSGQFLGNVQSSRVVGVQTTTGITGLISFSDNSKGEKMLEETGSATTATRVSWRELIDK